MWKKCSRKHRRRPQLCLKWDSRPEEPFSYRKVRECWQRACVCVSSLCRPTTSTWPQCQLFASMLTHRLEPSKAKSFLILCSCTYTMIVLQSSHWHSVYKANALSVVVFVNVNEWPFRSTWQTIMKLFVFEQFVESKCELSNFFLYGLNTTDLIMLHGRTADLLVW